MASDFMEDRRKYVTWFCAQGSPVDALIWVKTQGLRGMDWVGTVAEWGHDHVYYLENGYLLGYDNTWAKVFLSTVDGPEWRKPNVGYGTVPPNNMFSNLTVSRTHVTFRFNSTGKPRYVNSGTTMCSVWVTGLRVASRPSMDS